jgi:hypothetical protein
MPQRTRTANQYNIVEQMNCLHQKENRLKTAQKELFNLYKKYKLSFLLLLFFSLDPIVFIKYTDWFNQQ